MHDSEPIFSRKPLATASTPFRYFEVPQFLLIPVPPNKLLVEIYYFTTSAMKDFLKISSLKKWLHWVLNSATSKDWLGARSYIRKLARKAFDCENPPRLSQTWSRCNVTWCFRSLCEFPKTQYFLPIWWSLTAWLRDITCLGASLGLCQKRILTPSHVWCDWLD